ncbi:MAG: hypothetical protein SXA11_22345 [Cyanobacteriota bacterium]|nr:hypothetical protein [Cyanobacteriota bacterium]
MSLYVEHLEATGVYGLFDISQSFRPGVNVLFARRGNLKLFLRQKYSNKKVNFPESFLVILFLCSTIHLPWKLKQV